jgi:hypothetical protein
VRKDFFGLRKVWEPIDNFMNMFGIPSVCGKDKDAIDRIVTSTNEYINERWKFERGQPPARKLAADPGLYVLNRWLNEAELLSFLSLNFLMGYHRLPELEYYWEMKPDTGFGLGLFPQSMTRERLKFISKHIVITSPAEIEEKDRDRGRSDPLGRIRWLIDNLNRSAFRKVLFWVHLFLTSTPVRFRPLLLSMGLNSSSSPMTPKGTSTSTLILIIRLWLLDLSPPVLRLSRTGLPSMA